MPPLATYTSQGCLPPTSHHPAALPPLPPPASLVVGAMVHVQRQREVRPALAQRLHALEHLVARPHRQVAHCMVGERGGWGHGCRRGCGLCGRQSQRSANVCRTACPFIV